MFKPAFATYSLAMQSGFSASSPRPPHFQSGASSSKARFYGIALILLLFAMLLRSIQFGNPTVQVDEQFYLLVGDRLFHGAVPFVDIWDRKPIGLFAVYAAIRLLCGDGVLQYQLVAALVAAATAIVIARIALRLAPPRGALISGLVYLVYLMVNGGDGGQAPVFYNLPVAVAALIVVKVIERPRFDRTAAGLASVSMLLFGIAMQIKYAALFEGVYVGLFLLYICRKRCGRLAVMIGMAAIWCLLALAPTLAVMAAYWHAGMFGPFMFTNFQSILARSPVADLDIPGRLLNIALQLIAPATIAFLAITPRRRLDNVHLFIFGWACASLAGLLLFGTYHDHYALPLLVPFAVAGAPIYGGPGLRVAGRGPIWNIGAVVLVAGLVAALVVHAGLRRSRGDGTAVLAAVKAVGQRPTRCIFVFNGDPILYHLTNSCLPTVYSFPTLLSEKRDAASMGIDQMTELRRTMASRPQYVFTRSPTPPEAQPAAWAYMAGELSRNYRPILRRQEGHFWLLAYARRAGS